MNNFDFNDLCIYHDLQVHEYLKVPNLENKMALVAPVLI